MNVLSATTTVGTKGKTLIRSRRRRALALLLLALALYVTDFSFGADTAEYIGRFLRHEGVSIVVGFAVSIVLIRILMRMNDRDRRKHSQKALRRLAKKDIALAKDSDDPNRKFEEMFWRYKQDWNSQDLDSIASYATEDFCRQTAYLRLALQSNKRSFTVDDIKLLHFDPYDVRDRVGVQDDEVLFQVSYGATFTLSEEGRADDKIHHLFYEFWYFTRSGTKWQLAEVAGNEAGLAKYNKSLITFFSRQGLVRTLPPLGALLPRSGALFNSRPSVVGAALRKWLDLNYEVQKGSESNTTGVLDHYVGQWGDTVVQLYFYIAKTNPKLASGVAPVAQISLPKEYGHIVICPKGQSRKLKIGSSYQRLTLEWPQFNERYEVYAANADVLASLELVNPDFMAYLYDNLPLATLEVQGNSLYVYTLFDEDTSIQEGRQASEALVGVARRAFKELKR